jgi:MraZ protein
MIEFTGTYNATLDDKGRFVLPAAFINEMGDIVDQPIYFEKNHFKPCIDIYPKQYWEIRANEFLKTLDRFDEDDEKLKQFFYDNFQKIEMAPNNRITIPADFKKYGNITKSLVLKGMGDSIRMWDAEEYNNSEKLTRPEFVTKFKEKRNKQ